MAFADSTLLAVKLCSGAFGLGHLGPPIFRGHSGQGHSDWGIMLWNDLTERMDGKGNSE